MNNSLIHSTAVISPKAVIGEGVSIEPYAVIYDDVVIGEGSAIGPHAVLYDGARIGKNVKIHQSVSIAHIPQDLKFGNEVTYTEIGDNTIIHEFVTVHRGTHVTGKTTIGKNCMLMNYVHVAHDCTVGDNCIIANSVQIAGHCSIGNWVNIGGLCPVHQFVHIGNHAMVSGGLAIPKDVPPYILANDYPLRYTKINGIGLKRRGFTNDQINHLTALYRELYFTGMNMTQACEAFDSKYPDDPFAMEIVDFIRRSNRGLIGK